MGVRDIHTLEFINKPATRANERPLRLIGGQPAHCVFVDDAPRSLRPAV